MMSPAKFYKEKTWVTEGATLPLFRVPLLKVLPLLSKKILPSKI
jgi:hypothetical protein